ncbi:hypothetical protein LXJ59_27530, partial [Escherichia coli]|nr:hypothetical protein [Escherichia coli]
VSPLVPHLGSVLFPPERPCNWQALGYPGPDNHPPTPQISVLSAVKAGDDREKTQDPISFGKKFCGKFLSFARGFAK